MKSAKGIWDDLFDLEPDEIPEEGGEISLQLEGQTGEGILFLEEAHEALNRLSQKANKRGKVMKHPRRAESWH